ncbi:MAG: Na+/H+ antiporter NhaA [Actinomycetes bacterium]
MSTKVARPDPVGGRLGRALVEFLRLEAAGGIVLLVATIAALVLANTSAANWFHDFWLTEVGLRWGSFEFVRSLEFWVNDGLMTIFFFVVGLEIKQELVVGELRDPRKAALPAIAAIGGMVVPAALFLSVTAGSTATRGWGIPMATDIAFAVGVLALLSKRVPPPIRLFLLTLAIVDDVGGIIVIAVVYSSGLRGGYLLAAAVGVLVAFTLRRLGVPWISAYVVVGVVVWYCTYRAGIHPTIAGAVMGLLAPAVPLRPAVQVPEFTPGRATIDRRISESLAASRFARDSIPVTARLGDALHPFSSFVVVPLFALANAGVHIGGDLVSTLTDPVALGIMFGLVVGKPLGIALATEVALRSRLADLPAGVTRAHVLAAGSVAGIGFTVALFVTALAFTDPVQVDHAKIGVLFASIASAVLGSLLFARLPVIAPVAADHSDDVRFGAELADVDPTDD